MMDLFRGRQDVYPRRFESKRTGRSGYQLSCGNEWKKGRCGKPNLRCANSSYCEFQPVGEDIKHMIRNVAVMKGGASKKKRKLVAEPCYKSFIQGVIPTAQSKGMGIIGMKAYFRGMATQLPGMNPWSLFFTMRCLNQLALW